MEYISKNLTLQEVITSQTAIRLNIKNVPTSKEIENLKYIAEKIFQPIRAHFDVPIRISSGYRSKELNKAVGGSKNSQHITGQALDIQGTNGVKNSQIFEYIKKYLIFDQLIWEFGDDKEPAWVHVSLSKNEPNRGNILVIGSAKKV